MAMRGLMKTVNIAELKNRLSTYVRFARNGEEVLIKDRNRPVAKLIPFTSEELEDEDLLLVAEGKMKLAEVPLDVDALLKIPTAKLKGNYGTAALVSEREEGW